MQPARDVLRQFVTGEIDEWKVIEWGQHLHSQTFTSLIDLPSDLRKEAIESALINLVKPEEPTIGQRYRALVMIEKALSGKIRLIELSSWVNQLDSRLLELDNYPEWLGHLWNALDWCDEDWTLHNQPHLQESLKSILNSLAEFDE